MPDRRDPGRARPSRVERQRSGGGRCSTGPAGVGIRLSWQADTLVPMTKREDLVADHVGRLISRFDYYVDIYERLDPFRRSGQLSSHVHTLKARAELGSAAAALADRRFLGSLYETLLKWGIGRRSSRLVPISEFEKALRDREASFVLLDGWRIDDPDLTVGDTSRALWNLIASLGIVKNDAPLVAGTKTLHHILPDLIPPMDRQYTRPFFGWYGQQFQYQQERAFEEAFREFWRIAVRVEPARLLGTDWRTARSKLLDNAVVGFCLQEGIKRA
jgi:hypothetical protein